MRRRFILSTALIASANMVAGCSTLETEVEPDWRSEAWAGAETAATEDARRLVLGGSSHVFMLDGNTGELIGGIGELDTSVGEQFRDAFNPVSHGPGYSLNPRSSNLVMLEGAGLLLVFNYERHTEQVLAIDLDSGEEAWLQDQYQYSIQQYEEIVSRATQAAGQTAAAILGGSGSGESSANRAERQRHFAQNLVAPVDNDEAILFKTFSGLVKMDSQTGEPDWRIGEFNGPGLLSVEELDNGDYLVLSSGKDLSRLQVAEEYNLARISADGETRWITEHSGKHTHDMTVGEGYVAVDATPLQVFDLDTGEMAWESHVYRNLDYSDNPSFIPQPDVLIADGLLYQAAPSHGEDGEMVTIGHPHRVKAFDLESGDVVWRTPETKTFFGKLEKRDDQLLVWGAGEYFGDHKGGGIKSLDAESGEVRWSSPEMETPNFMSRAPRVVDPVFDDTANTVYIAGPGDLFGFDIDTGEQILEQSLSDLGNTVGLVRHGGQMIVIGTEATAAYDPSSGESEFLVETEHVTDYHRRGDRLVLEIGTGGIMQHAVSGDDDGPSPPSIDPATGEPYDNSGTTSRGAVAVDLRTGELGEMAVLGHSKALRFGELADVYVDQAGRHVFMIDGDAKLVRFTL